MIMGGGRACEVWRCVRHPPTELVQEQVFRFDVAVRDAARVQVLHNRQQLAKVEVAWDFLKAALMRRSLLSQWEVEPIVDQEMQILIMLGLKKEELWAGQQILYRHSEQFDKTVRLFYEKRAQLEVELKHRERKV